jgi:Helix-turn-helix domain
MIADIYDINYRESEIRMSTPELRAEAVERFRSGFTYQQIADHYGFSKQAIISWCKKAGVINLTDRPRKKPVNESGRLCRYCRTESKTPAEYGQHLVVCLRERKRNVS